MSGMTDHMPDIIIKGARENNLKNIDIAIPRNKIVCFIGVSGSGKSTIAFDIIAREGQRQYFESLSSLARRYLDKSNRPLVDEIKGLSPTVIISQDRLHPSPRSTVGTVTETYTYLRLLFARAGWPVYDSSSFSFNHPLGACPECKGLGRAVEVYVSRILDVDKSLNEGALKPREWYVGGRQWSIIRASRYFDMDRKLRDYTPEELDKLLNAPPEMLASDGEYIVDRWTFQGIVYRISHRNTKVHRGPSTSDMKYFTFVDCPGCHGGRLKPSSLAVTIDGMNIGQVANLPVSDAIQFISRINHRNAAVIKPRLIGLLHFLINAGVGYLSLNRSTDTLSGGEAQRVKLARQLGCDLIETICVLDEPTAGLHPRDIQTVIANLQKLRDAGNTVLVVEHDETVIRSADHLIEVGPGGGKDGGTITFSGPMKDLLAGHTLTARYLNRPLQPPGENVRTPTGWLPVRNATRHNLKHITVNIPTGVLIALTGVSGAGKSSLVEEITDRYPDKVVQISQKPVGSNRRGCIATYAGIFDEIRQLFARSNRVSPSRFSYNSRTGCCPECRGLGFIDMDMNFLGEVRMKCHKCHGLRYTPDVLSYTYRDRTIAAVLAMTAKEAIGILPQPDIQSGLKMLMDVGLDYVTLGQSLDTLSGGESQRLKLASKLRSNGDFYILDEPTSGLHFADVEKLLSLLNVLVDHDNTVMVVEHNLEVIRNADWIIDLGPDGGDKGGTIVFQGTVAGVKYCPSSYTGKYLSY